MAATVQALIDAGPRLTHVGVLVLLIFLCFGILGSQLFAGSLRQRCHVYVDGFGLLLTDAVVACGGTYQCAGLEETVFALTSSLNRSRVPAYTQSMGPCALLNVSAAQPGDAFCCVPALPPATSAAYYNSQLGPTTTNSFYGLLSFDDVVHACLVVYRAITLEDWAVTMQTLKQGSDPGWGLVYMILLVLVPGWLATNLTLAVIYEQVHLHNMIQLRLARAEAKREADTALAEVDDGAGGKKRTSVLSVHVLGAPAALPSVSLALRRGFRVTLARKPPQRMRAAAGDERRRGVHEAVRRGWQRLVRACEGAVRWRWFSHVFTVLIIINTCVQCAAYVGMPLAMCQGLDIASLIFTILFAAEMVVKILGLGCGSYWSDPWNRLDGFIVIVSLVEVVITPSTGGNLVATTECASGINPSVFRTLRLMRLLSAIPSKSLRELLGIISGAASKTVALCLIFLLFLYTCALVGLAYFQNELERCQECEPLPRPLDLPLMHGGVPLLTATVSPAAAAGGSVAFASLTTAALGVGYEPQPMLYGASAASLCRCDPVLRVCLDDGGVSPPYLNGGRQTTPGGRAAGCFARAPSANFDSIGDALLTAFMIFTGEEYQNVLFLAMRNVNVWTFLFFTCALILGRYVLLNMYTAVILSCLASVRTQAARGEADDEPKATPVPALGTTAFGALLEQVQKAPSSATAAATIISGGGCGNGSAPRAANGLASGAHGLAAAADPAVSSSALVVCSNAAAPAPSSSDTEEGEGCSCSAPSTTNSSAGSSSGVMMNGGAHVMVPYAGGALAGADEPDGDSSASPTSTAAPGKLERPNGLSASVGPKKPQRGSDPGSPAEEGQDGETTRRSRMKQPTSRTLRVQQSMDRRVSLHVANLMSLNVKVGNLKRSSESARSFAQRVRQTVTGSRTHGTASSSSSALVVSGGDGGGEGGAGRLSAPMSADRAALMLQARFRQHKAWVGVRAIRLVREEQNRLTERGPNTADPLGLEKIASYSMGGRDDGAPMMPAANATRKWQPPKFSACMGVEADSSMGLGAFEEDIKPADVARRCKLEFEYLLPVAFVKAGAADGGDEDEDPFNMAPPPGAATPESAPPKDAGATGAGGRKPGGAGEYRNRKARKASGFELRLRRLVCGLRPAMRKLNEHAAFNGFIMLLILLSTIVLCLDSPRLAKDSTAFAESMRGLLAQFNLIFAILFTIEMGIKLIALGCRGYFCNYFNLLDAFCVFVGWATIVPGGESLGALKSLRTLRGLRPLRLITRIPSMAIVIEALIRALPAIANVTLVLLTFWLVFAILGVQVFGGSLASCTLFVPAPLAGGSQLMLPMTAMANQTICQAMARELDGVYDRAAAELGAGVGQAGGLGSGAGGGLGGASSLLPAFAPGSLCAWPAPPRQPVFNQTRCRLLWHTETSGFNNVPEGLLTLTEVAMLQGWSSIMHKAMSARGVGLAAIDDGGSGGLSRIVGGAYFVIFVLVGGFMLIKLFAGVVIDKFNRLRDERSGSAFMTDEQKEWVETRKLVQATRPLCQEVVPSQPLRRILYGIASHKGTEYVVMFMILLNVLFMAITSTYLGFDVPPPAWHITVEGVFTWFFIGEFGVKILALFPLGYFRVAWNCFDFFLCAVSVFDMSFKGNLNFNPTLLRLLRMFRIARLIRLVRSAKGLRTLLLTMTRCMPALGIICSLVCLNAIIFATIGMSLFGHVIPQPQLGYGGQWPAFDHFPDAFLLMIVMATSEQWPTLMRAVAVQPPFCGEAAGYVADTPGAVPPDCGASWVVAAGFFVLYQFLGALLLMNLMVGVVVDEFSNTSIQQNMRVPQTAISEFQEAWIRLDPDGTGYISAHYLPWLLSKLLPPLGVKGTKLHEELPAVALLKKLHAAWLPLRYGQVQFQETLFALAREEVGQRLPDCPLRAKLDRHARRVLDLRHLRDAPVEWNAHEYYAAEMVQRTYRGFHMREALHAHKQREIKKERVTQAFRISSTLLTSYVANDAAACSSRLAERPSHGGRDSLRAPAALEAR